MTELLIFACSPRVAELPECGSEAVEVAMATSWADCVSIFYGGDAAKLHSFLASRTTRRFLFSGHADVKFATPPSSAASAPAATDASGATADSVQNPNPAKPKGLNLSLGFTKPGGQLEAVDPTTLAQLLGSHSAVNGGGLELVVLNGCRSEALGRACHTAGVPYVVCWCTKLLDAAARLFARTLFQQLASGVAIHAAFEEAKRIVTSTHRDWRGKRHPHPGACHVRSPRDRQLTHARHKRAVFEPLCLQCMNSSTPTLFPQLAIRRLVPTAAGR
jgi:hypothetical protein